MSTFKPIHQSTLFAFGEFLLAAGRHILIERQKEIWNYYNIDENTVISLREEEMHLGKQTNISE